MKHFTAKRTLAFLIGLLVTSVGDALIFKGAVGASPVEAMQQTINYITGIRIGTVAMATQFIFLFLQIVMRREITLPLILQIPVCVIQGYIVNLIIYVFLGAYHPSYPARVVILLTGIILAAVGVGQLMLVKLAVFPVEGFCDTFSEKVKIEYARVRQLLDVVLTVGCLLVSFLFHYPYAIREGTVICALIFAPIMKAAMNRLPRWWEE